VRFPRDEVLDFDFSTAFSLSFDQQHFTKAKLKGPPKTGVRASFVS
jgi:hypothetical protein